MYNLELLKKFCVVAKYCSFTKASEKLFISQPALSKSIKLLEEQMNIKLFIRTKKSVELTKEGDILYQLLYPKIEYISNLDAIIDSFRSKHNTNLRIGCNATITKYVLTPILKNFLENHKDINLSIKNDTTYNLISLLQKKELDLLIVNLPIKNSTNLKIIKIKEVQDIFIANNKYSYLKDTPITFKQLQSLPIIVNSEGSVTREHFDYCCSLNNVSITPHVETVRQSLLIDFCILGLGVCFTTYEFANEEIRKNNLNILKIEPSIPKRSIGIVVLNQPQSQLIEDLIEKLKIIK